MSNIQVGEYVRTPEQGWIGKLVEIIPNVLNYYKIDVKKEVKRYGGNSDNYIYSRDGCGLKHSFNIIDLIEEGDYVNGEKVIENLYDFVRLDGKLILKADICTIVTKERFKESEYKVC